ncbi:hypothetical protein [Acuticoccus sp.]|uniref:hypothetical protein n=1 Tax=Acuticoccus sp. TaxID=1904378 RepID=UPI003B528E44
MAHWLMGAAVAFAALAFATAAAAEAAQDGAEASRAEGAGPQEAAAGLYPGEEIREAAGFPAITWFAKGEANAPLVVFVPGAHHTARVAYGGHDGSRAEDFLAHHLLERGYSVLAISYPIGIAEGGLPTDHPDFMIRDWGRQTAQLAAETIEAEGLTGGAIVAGWSMGGKLAQAAHEAARDAGLDLKLFIGLAATPGLPGLIAITREYPMLPSGYADRRKNFDGWYQQVAAEGEEEGHTIVPEDVFKAQYQGDIPINLQGYGQLFRDGAFVMDPAAAMEDAKPFHFDDYPLVGVIIPNGRRDKRHAITDQAAWGLYNANTLLSRYMGDVDVNALSDADWTRLTELADGLDERLSHRVDGNHFFFMGATGAAATAEAIASLDEEAAALKAELTDLLGTPIN